MAAPAAPDVPPILNPGTASRCIRGCAGAYHALQNSVNVLSHATKPHTGVFRNDGPARMAGPPASLTRFGR
ncbi:MAG: hypothetical protein ACTH5L_09520 [Halomonas sp.]